MLASRHPRTESIHASRAAVRFLQTLFLVAALCPLAFAALTDSLSTYYTCDDANTSGTNAYDIHGTAHANLRNGVSTSLMLKLGQAYGFDGVNDIMNTTIDRTLYQNGDNFTICGWFNVTQTTADSDGLFGTLDSANVGFGLNMYDNGTMYQWTGAAFWLGGIPQIRNGTAFHLCAVHYSNETFKYVVNGTYMHTNADAFSESLMNLSFGNSYAVGQYITDGMVGKEDELGFWTRSLGNSEIVSLYNSGAGLEYPFELPASYLIVNITTANNTHEGNFNFNYYVNTSAAPSSVCYIMVNDTNLLNVSDANNTPRTYTNASFSDGTYTFWVNCTNAALVNRTPSYTQVIDRTAPTITLTSPSPMNTSSYGYEVVLRWTAEDAYLYAVNETIFSSTGAIMHHWNDTGLAANVTRTQNISNLSLWTQGNYTLSIFAADSHTGAIFDEQITYIEKSAARTTLALSSARATFSTDVTFIKDVDRFKFVIDGSLGAMTIRTDAELHEIRRSAYPCHYVFSKYWLDLDGLPEAKCVQVDKNTLSATWKPTEKLLTTNSIGGLNEQELRAWFLVDRTITNATFTAPTAANYTGAFEVNWTSCVFPTDSSLRNYTAWLVNSTGALFLNYSGTDRNFTIDSVPLDDGFYQFRLACYNNFSANGTSWSPTWRAVNHIPLALSVYTNITNQSVYSSMLTSLAFGCFGGFAGYSNLSIYVNSALNGMWNVSHNSIYSRTLPLPLTTNTIMVRCAFNSTEDVNATYTTYYEQAAGTTELLVDVELFVYTMLWLSLFVVGMLFALNILVFVSGLGFVFTGLEIIEEPTFKVLYGVVGAVLVVVWAMRGFTQRNL